MNPEYTVFFRIAAYMVSGWLAGSDWLPPDVSSQLVSAEMIEMITAALVALATLALYQFSEAKKALKDKRFGV